jgi:HK97 family phage major capsid protein
MTDLKLVNTELEDVLAERTLLREKHKGATMPEEARVRDEQLVERAAKLRFLVEETKQAERDKQFEETAKWMEDPIRTVPTHVNADDEGRRVMMKAGWKISNGMITRETSMGDLPFIPEEVMFGPIPGDDPVTAKYFKQTRATFQPDYRNAYVKWMRAPFHGEGADAAALRGLSSQEQNALSEGQSDLGGFAVPPDLQAEMFVRMAQESVMRRLARVVPTSRDKVQWPAVKAATSNGTIYSSGFVGGIVGETPAFSDVDPGFEQFEISVKKFRTATKMSNDWIADAAGNMLAFLAQNGAENLALVEDYYFINGDGTPLQPVGILNAGLSTTTVEGSTTDHISNTTSNAGSGPLIDALPYLVPAQYAGRGQWLMARHSEGKIRGLVDANGRSWWMPQQAAGGAGTTPRELGGYPVNNSDFMPVGGTNGNKVLVFGDFSAYVIAQRASMSTIVLRERFADTEQTGIIINERAGGGLWNTDALYIGIV